jgi:hypothetical protein
VANRISAIVTYHSRHEGRKLIAMIPIGKKGTHLHLEVEQGLESGFRGLVLGSVHAASSLTQKRHEIQRLDEMISRL